MAGIYANDTAALDQARLIRGVCVLRDMTSENPPVTRDEVFALLRMYKGALAQRFGVTDLALFGFFGRNRAGERSDIDNLVRFGGRATSKRYFGTQF